MKLLEPGRIGKLSLKNRIVMAPMQAGAYTESDGKMSERLIDLYVARAQGGTGLIITSSLSVRRATQQGIQAYPLADHPLYIARFNQLAEAVHDYGTKVVVQLSAGVGRNAPLKLLRTAGTTGPSPNPAFFDPSVKSRELATGEIEQLVQSFELAAQIVSSSGIDGIEINCHGAYLLDEFTSPHWNRRTDKYGGDLEGRSRFLIEVIKAVKKGAGEDFPLIVKLSLTHFVPEGRQVQEGLEIAKRLEATGVDALEIDAGCYEVRYWLNPPTTLPMGCAVDLAVMVKGVVKVPVIAVGKLGDPELSERVLQEGKADFIALARPLLADAEWANKVKDGRPEDICPCIGDHEGCHKRLYEGKFWSGTVNPSCGYERELTIGPAETKKTVLVVGGGPGGMEAARVAAWRGHRVTLWEKGDALGGNLIAAAVPDFKKEFRKLIDYYIFQIKKLGVDIQLGKKATLESIEETGPDVIFIATGSTPVIPEIPGVHEEKVVTAVDLLLGKCKVGESVVVIGGGLVGCETALYLAQKGRRLTVVEILNSIMGDMYSINRLHMEKLLTDSQVRIMMNTKVLEITDEGIGIVEKEGKREKLRADTIVLATGFEPNDTFSEALKDKVPEIYSLGDCVQPRRVINAVWEGFRFARLI
jgi:2-enoate reductase